MNCPACSRSMTLVEVGKVKVDVCDGGCGGIWFDHGELQQMDDGDEPTNPELLRIAVDPELKVDHEPKRNCPVCDGVTMMRHFYSTKQEVVIDKCAGCNGIWLDAGEYEAIRGQFGTEAGREGEYERDSATAWGKASGDAQAKLEKDTATLQQINGVLKYIRPSYYIRGK